MPFTHSMLEVQTVWGYYGPVTAVRDVTFSLQSGECLAIVGPNGAGKSTLLKAICGTLRSRGVVSLAGRRIDRLPTGSRYRSGLGYMPQEKGVIGPLTVRENLRLAWTGGKRQTSFAEMLEKVFDVFPELEARIAKPASLLSGGQRQMLGIGKVLAMSADVLLLDEPTAGLSPALITRMVEALEQIRAAGATMALVEQNTQAAARLADRFLAIRGGEVAYQCTRQQFTAEGLAQSLILGTRRAPENSTSPR